MFNCLIALTIFSTELPWDTSISARVHYRSWLKSNKWHCFSLVTITQRCCNSASNLDFTFFLYVYFYSLIDSLTVKRDTRFCINYFSGLYWIYRWTNERNILEHSGRCNTSNMKNLVLSHFQTLRRKLKIKCAAEYFWWTSRCLEMCSNTVLSVWYVFSVKAKTKKKRGEIKS